MSEKKRAHFEPGSSAPDDTKAVRRESLGKVGLKLGVSGSPLRRGSIEEVDLHSFLSLSRDDKLKLSGSAGKSPAKTLRYELEESRRRSNEGDADESLLLPMIDPLLDPFDMGHSPLSHDSHSSSPSESGSESTVHSHLDHAEYSTRIGDDLMSSKAEIIALKAIVNARERAVQVLTRDLDQSQQSFLEAQKEYIEEKRLLVLRNLLDTVSLRFEWQGLRKCWRRWVVASASTRIHQRELHTRNAALDAQREEYHEKASQLEHECKLEALAKSFTRQRKRRILQAWSQQVSERDKRRLEFVRILLVFSERLLRFALQRWRLKITAMLSDERKKHISMHSFAAALMMRRLRRQSLGRALALWKMSAEWETHRATVLLRTASILVKRCSLVSAAFSFWRVLTTALPLARVHAIARLERFFAAQQLAAQTTKVLAMFLRWKKQADVQREIGGAANRLDFLLWVRSRQAVARALARWRATSRLLGQAANNLTAAVRILLSRSDRERLYRGISSWRKFCRDDWDLVQLNDRVQTGRAMFAARGERAAGLLLTSTSRLKRSLLKSKAFAELRRVASGATNERRLAILRSLLLVADRTLELHGDKYRARYALHRWRAMTLRTAAEEGAAMMLFSKAGRASVRRAWVHWKTLRHNEDCSFGLRRMFVYCDLRQKFCAWRTALEQEAKLEHTLDRLFRRVYIYLLRWWMRRWAYKLAIQRLTTRQRNFLGGFFPLWRGYARLMKSRRMRLRHTIFLTQTGGLRYCVGVWAAKTKRARQLERACNITAKFVSKVPKTLTRLSLAHWRSYTSCDRRETAERIGRGLSLALKRIVSAEQEREQEIMHSSLLSSEIDKLRAYARALIHQAIEAFAYKRSVRAQRQCLASWAQLRLIKQQRKRVLSVLISRWTRLARQEALALRFSRWRGAAQRLSLVFSQNGIMRKKFAVAQRRRRHSVLVRVLRCWRASVGNRYKLLLAMRRIKRSSLRRHTALAFYRWRAALLRDLTAHRAQQRLWFQRLAMFASQSRIVRQLGVRRVRVVCRDKRRALLRHIVQQWCLETYRARHERRMLSRVAVLLRRTACANTLRRWARLRDARQLTRAFSNSLSRLLRRRNECHAAKLFRRWKDVARAHTVEVQQLLALRSCQAWALRRLMSRRDVRLLRPAKAAAFHLWLGASRQAAQRVAFQRASAEPLVRQARERRLLRSALRAWRSSPQLVSALPLRLYGFPLLAHSAPVSGHWVSALHAEASGHRSWRACLELVCEGLDEALPTFVPAVFVLREPELLFGLELVPSRPGDDGAPVFSEKRILLGEGVVGRCVSSGAPLITRRRDKKLVELVLPLLWHGTCVGAVQLTSRITTTAAATWAPAAEAVAAAPVSASRRVRFSDDEAAAAASERDGSPAPSSNQHHLGSELVLPLDTTRFHDEEMLASPHEEGSLALATVLFVAALQCDPPLSLKSCLMAAPVLFAAAELMHLHYACNGASLSSSSTASLAADPSLAEVLEKLRAAESKVSALTDRLALTENRAAALVHELESSNAQTVAICNQRVARLEASRDKYRAKALGQQANNNLGLDKENFL